MAVAAALPAELPVKIGDQVSGRVGHRGDEGCWLDVAGITQTVFLQFRNPLEQALQVEVGDDLCSLEVLSVNPSGCITVGLASNLQEVLQDQGNGSAGRGRAGRGRGRGSGRGEGRGRGALVAEEPLPSSTTSTPCAEEAPRHDEEGEDPCRYNRQTLLRARDIALQMSGASPAVSSSSSFPKLRGPTQAQRDKHLLRNIKAGELPPRDWRLCSEGAKAEGLLEALRASQMHIVYALQPESIVFREGMQSSSIDDTFLAKALTVLCQDARESSKPQPPAQPVSWLLERGAPVSLLLRPDVSPDRVGGLQLLGSLDPGVTSRPNILQEVIFCTQDRDPRVRFAAVDAMGRINSGAPTAAVATALAKLLRDADGRVREAAANGLGSAGEDGVRAAAGLLSDNSVDVRGFAAKAIYLASASGGPTSGAASAAAACSDTFTAWLHSEEYALRLLAAQALGTMGEAGGAAAAEILAQLLLSETKDDVREAAVVALGAMGSASAAFVEVVASLLDDSSPYVQEAAHASLVKMLGSAAPE
mmetsp:Transcript_73405/g.174911  ORF Transcript_73405/g.174911 Transcript_73405/m.174911 type:complete len:533 (+) Transcript_73405:112-1710(+)